MGMFPILAGITGGTEVNNGQTESSELLAMKIEPLSCCRVINAGSGNDG